MVTPSVYGMTMNNTETPTTTYTVKLYCATRWATGTFRGTTMRTVHVEEDATILGGMRAISEACARYEGDVLSDIHSPEIEPNPAELGWPIGEAR